MITEEEYARAIERINKQLYRIEKYAETSGEKITDYAYRLAMYDIKSIFGYADARGTKERKRFSRKIPLTKEGKLNQKRAGKVMRAIERFYELPSSTLTGMKEIYEKRAETLSNKFGLDKALTAKQLKKIFDSGLWARLSEKYASKTVITIIGQFERQKEDLKAKLEKGEAVVLTDSRYSKRVAKIFKDNPDALERYLKG